MAVRAHSGKLVVAGVLVVAVGGAVLLNVVTAGPPEGVGGLVSPRPTVTPSGSIVVRPSSGPATPGRSEQVDITTACGFLPAVDFDGSFWRPGNGRTMSSVGRNLLAPIDPSTVTLQEESSALLRTASGQVVVLVRSRLRSIAVPVC